MVANAFHKLIMPPATGKTLFDDGNPSQLATEQNAELNWMAADRVHQTQKIIWQITNHLTQDSRNAPTDQSQVPVWVQQMEDKKLADLNTVPDQMDAMADAAIDKISTFPPEEPTSAPYAWNFANGETVGRFAEIANVFEEAYWAIASFSRNARDQVEDASNFARDTCKNAVIQAENDFHRVY